MKTSKKGYSRSSTIYGTVVFKKDGQTVETTRRHRKTKIYASVTNPTAQNGNLWDEGVCELRFDQKGEYFTRFTFKSVKEFRKAFNAATERELLEYLEGK